MIVRKLTIEITDRYLTRINLTLSMVSSKQLLKKITYDNLLFYPYSKESHADRQGAAVLL